MTPIERLRAIEAVKSLKARYFIALDGKDHAAYAAIFGDDGVFDLRRYDINGIEAGRAPPGEEIRGGTAIAAFVLGSLEGIQSSHRGSMPLIDIISPDEASGTWTMEDWLRGPDGEMRMAGFGYYRDRYVQKNGQWFIGRSELIRWT